MFRYLATSKDALFVIQCITSLFSIPTARDSHPKSCSSLQKQNLTMHCKENIRNNWHKWQVKKSEFQPWVVNFFSLPLSPLNCELLLKFPNPFLISPSFAKKTCFYLGYQNTKTNNQTLHQKVGDNFLMEHFNHILSETSLKLREWMDGLTLGKF